MVMVLYVAVSFAVFGNLPLDRVVAAREYVLAEAAKPILGHVGFTIIAVAALISTASSINANLFAVTNVTYQLAKDGELPSAFGRPIEHSREGLLISSLFIVVLTLFLNLSQIAVLGSISVLFVHAITHIGHLRVIRETGASKTLVLIAIAVTLLAMVLSLYYQVGRSPGIVWMLAIFLVTAFVLEFLLQKILQRKVMPRTPQ